MDENTLLDQKDNAQPLNRTSSDGITNTKSTSSKRRIERSCALCHRRKIRCDKKSPCSTCIRTGVLCYYPSESKEVTRKEKTTISDIATRLVQLERTIVAISSTNNAFNSKSENGNLETSQQESLLQSRNETEALKNLGHSSENSTLGMLIHHGDEQSTQYVDEVLLSRVLEEEQEIQSILASQKLHRFNNSNSNSQFTSSPLPFGLLGLSSNQSFQYHSEERLKLYPQKWEALRLWQFFVQNVDPLAKVLHLPTVQLMMYTAIDDPDHASTDVKCLMFAIYFAATTSLDPNEVVNLLGLEKSTALNQFRTGLEFFLASSNILDKPSITGLQALAIYLQTARAQNTGRSLWIINGIAIRVAQSIGLHRDPSKFGLSLFDSEIRRRLWWHLVAHDARAAEDHGLTVNLVDTTTDTQYPLAVDDSALEPTMTEPPLTAVGQFTDMLMITFKYEASKSMRLLYRTLQTSSTTVSNAPASESVRQDILNPLKDRMKTALACCNLVIPFQRQTSLMIQAVVSKVDFVSRQQWIYLGGAAHKSKESRITEESLIDACRILELNIELQTDELLRNYRWAAEIFPQYHIILYVLWHLSVKPVGPTVERAWRAIDGIFALEYSRRHRQDVGVSEPGIKWAVLEALKEKASRDRNYSTIPHGSEEVSNTDDMDVDMKAFGWNNAFDDKVGLSWETGFLDWESLVEGLDSTRSD